MVYKIARMFKNLFTFIMFLMEVRAHMITGASEEVVRSPGAELPRS